MLKNDDNDKPRVGKYDKAYHESFKRNTGVKTPTGAPPGNTNAMRHGMYANRFLSDDEKKIFEKIIAQLYQDFVFNKSSDFMQVELVAVYFIKLSRAQEEGNWDAAERLDRMIRCHLKDLKTTKITRETDPASKRAATPAEWASKLVKTLADEKKDGKDKPAKKRKRKKDGG